MISGMKQMMITLLAMVLALPCVAQVNRLYMNDFEIEPDSTITVSLYLTNEDPTRGLQFNLKVPEGLTRCGYESTAYSNEYNMTVVCESTGANKYRAFVYPPTRICYPADNAREVVSFTFKASSGFKGGELVIDGCKGSTMDSKTFNIEGDTVVVTVPARSLVGIPVDQQSADEPFFNLQEKPAR